MSELKEGTPIYFIVRDKYGKWLEKGYYMRNFTEENIGKLGVDFFLSADDARLHL